MKGVKGAMVGEEGTFSNLPKVGVSWDVGRVILEAEGVWLEAKEI